MIEERYSTHDQIATPLTSESYSGSAISPYVIGYFGPGLANRYATRGSVGSAAYATATDTQGAAGIYTFTGSGSGADYQGMGITAFVRGLEGGFGGWEPPPYEGPTGEIQVDYVYGEGNAGPHAVTALSDGSTFTYDANGNMVTRFQDDTNWTYTFDAENRLVQTSDGTTTTTYRYDAGGSRLKRIVDDGSTTTTTLYVAGMEIQTVGTTETQRTVHYPMGGAFRIIGGDDAGLYYRHTDHLGSTSVLSDSTGAQVAGSDLVFAPFGEVRVGALSDLTDFGYTGQRHDPSTGGLVYYGARYYLPGLKRFISPDSIIPGTANPQAFNRYTYVLNNPLKFIDPTGHAYQMSDPEWNYINSKKSTSSSYSPLPKPVLIAETDPANDKYSGSETPYRDYILDELSKYGVTVGNHGDKLTKNNNISESQKKAVLDVDKISLSALRQLYYGVQALGRAFASSGINSAYGAFQMMLGMTNVSVFNDIGSVGWYIPGTYKTDEKGNAYDGYYGINWGKIDGIFHIGLAINPLSSNSSIERKRGSRLGAHEFGHSFVILGGGIYSPLNPNDPWAGLGVMAGQHPCGYSGCVAVELTADVVASWALNDFVGVPPNEHRKEAFAFMSQAIERRIIQGQSHQDLPWS